MNKFLESLILTDSEKNNVIAFLNSFYLEEDDFDSRYNSAKSRLKNKVGANQKGFFDLKIFL